MKTQYLLEMYLLDNVLTEFMLPGYNLYKHEYEMKEIKNKKKYNENKKVLPFKK